MRRTIVASTMALALLFVPAPPDSADFTPVAVDHRDCKVEMGPNIQVSKMNSPVREVQIAVNPKNGDNLVASGILLGDSTDRAADHLDQRQRVMTYTSRDAGKTWQMVQRPPRTKEEGQPPLGGDPIVVFSRAGTAIYSNDVHYPTPGYPDDGNTYSYSTDGGITWSPAIAFKAAFFDHPMFAADLTKGKFGGAVYAVGMKADPDPADSSAYRYYLTAQRSFDDGRTFTESIVVRTKDFNRLDDGMNTDNDVVLSTTGRLFVPFHSWDNKGLDTMMLAGEKRPKQIRWFVTSDDGGATFSAPRVPKTTTGADLMGPLMITYPGWAADLTGGPFKDRMYVVWSEPSGPGQRWQLLFSFSTDGGTTWLPPKVLEDAALDPTDYTMHDTFPAIKVDKNGVLFVSWYHFEYAGGTGKDRAVKHIRYVTASVDGGASFLAAKPLATESSLMSKSPLGDYLNVAAGPDGVFHNLWMDARTGKQQMWYASARVTCDGKPAVAR